MAFYADLPDVPDSLNKYFLNFANPYSGYTKYLMDKGLSGADPMSNYARDQYGRIYQDYLAASAENPGLGFLEYVRSTDPTASLGKDYLNYQNPKAGFYSYLGKNGLTSATDPAASFAKDQYDSTYQAWQAAQAGSPGLGFTDYLRKTKPDYRATYETQSPESRGFSTSISTPRVKWSL